MPAYAAQVQAIQWTGANFTDVQDYMTAQSSGAYPNVDWTRWSANDNLDGTLTLAAPTPRKPITVQTGQWLVVAYGIVPNVIDNDLFLNFFPTAV